MQSRFVYIIKKPQIYNGVIYLPVNDRVQQGMNRVERFSSKPTQVNEP